MRRELRLGRDRTLEDGEELIEMSELRVHALEPEQRGKLGRIGRQRLRVCGGGISELGLTARAARPARTRRRLRLRVARARGRERAVRTRRQRS